VTRSPAHRHPAWFDRPVHRLRLLAELRTVGTGVTVVPPSRAHRGGFALRITLTPAGLAPYRVTIEFGSNNPDVPHITVPGPTSPHRYNDGSLCIWYPYDPPEQRWTSREGGVALAGHICTHLIREAWWRETGEWAGEEAPHEPPAPPIADRHEGHPTR
jgi:hypothetical protein